VGRDPLVDVPLSLEPGTPPPAELPEPVVHAPHTTPTSPTNSPAEQHDSSPTAALDVPRGVVLASFVGDAERTGIRSQHVAARAPLGSNAPDPFGVPGPWPSPLASMPSSQSVPSAGGAATSADPAAIDAIFVLPPLLTRGSGSADWRAPGGLPARPGSRPD
jgi:hypothetical protein